LGLGRALVEELGLDPGVDTLSRWMAHHIAELIKAAETASTEERSVKLAKCADTILKLWEHRHHFPKGRCPFEDWEPFLRALKSLDPCDDTPRYFRPVWSEVDENEQHTEAGKWLKLARYLDSSAKILIRYCLTQAAQSALDKSRSWVALAETAGLERDVDLQIIRLIANESDLANTTEADSAIRKELQDRAERLEKFEKMANILSSDLRRRLKKATAVKKGS
jgi:hypothetical protein